MGASRLDRRRSSASWTLVALPIIVVTLLLCPPDVRRRIRRFQPLLSSPTRSPLTRFRIKSMSQSGRVCSEGQRFAAQSQEDKPPMTSRAASPCTTIRGRSRPAAIEALTKKGSRPRRSGTKPLNPRKEARVSRRREIVSFIQRRPRRVRRRKFWGAIRCSFRDAVSG